MIERLLQIHLEPIARDLRRWRLLRALALGWVLAAGVGLLFLMLQRGTGWNSPWAFLLVLLGALGATVLAWYRTRRSVLDYQAIARKIEAVNPRLHAVLLTAVEQKPDS